ncbi:MAG: tRNA (guanosine(37)-N1)-methyltransferase TrmD [Clostridia bacterium]|nr:tRNA (guanosine(37)-N1)-methyltransferase TrmD [Clostridia bacterium]
MTIDILTLFPEMFEALKTSLLGKAAEKDALKINLHNIRDFSENKHKKCDDYPFGGGPGMLMMPEPIFACMESIEGFAKALKIYMSPKGKTLNMDMVQDLAKHDHIIILCGHYEGVDERVIENLIDLEISIGDYVLTGGEIPAMVVVDSVARFLPNVLHCDGSALDESFMDGTLEYPQYTRPSEFRGMKVPEVLLSGNHAEIAKWRKEQSLEITKKRRPDLLKK